MTVQLGDTGKVAYGTLKTITTTLATPRETLLGTPVALPTTESGTSQISFTVQTSDLPTFSGNPLSVKYCATLYGSGKNTDAATQTVSWRVLKNGVSVATGTQTSIATNNFWSQSQYQFYDVSVGDVLELRLWASSANVNYDYYAISILPTRMELGKSYLNKDVAYSNPLSVSLTGGTPVAQNTNSYLIYPTTSTLNVTTSTTVTFGAMQWHSTFQSFRADRGDNTLAVGTVASATNHPFYQRQWIPGTITFREVLR